MKFKLVAAVAMATAVAFVMSGAANAAPAQDNTGAVTTTRNADVVKVALGNAGVVTAAQRSSAVTAVWSCSVGNVCFYTGPDGSGSRCMWSIADNDWATGASVCSWATTTNVKSVWNRGTSSATGVEFFTSTNYASSSRIGCTRQGGSGNLAGTYKLRSHRWTSGACG